MQLQMNLNRFHLTQKLSKMLIVVKPSLLVGCAAFSYINVFYSMAFSDMLKIVINNIHIQY